MKFLNFGSCNIDYVYSLDHILRAGETLSSDALNIFPGGKGLNQSIALARAGAKVYHAGCIGEDGELLIETLKADGVDLSYIERTEGKNGHAIIQVSRDGENSIFLFAGSNEKITEEHIDRVLADFSEGDFLILQNEINNLPYLIERAHERGMFIILNPSPINAVIFELDLEKISCLILNEGEITDITGIPDTHDAAKALLAKHPSLKIMLTLGKSGCVYIDKNERVFHPIFEARAVDTTAAGDTFTGYFAYELSRKEKMQNILKMASCASAISVSRHGAAPSIPTRKEVLDGLKTMKTVDTNDREKRLRARIESFVSDNIATVTLCSLADELGYSSVYTGALIKKLCSVSFSKLVCQKRLELAEELISKTELSISEIIKRTGYENESYFREKFKAQYGKNPNEYRKNKSEKTL